MQKISNLEIEPLDTTNWGEEFNKKSYELTKQMSELLAKNSTPQLQ